MPLIANPPLNQHIKAEETCVRSSNFMNTPSSFPEVYANNGNIFGINSLFPSTAYLLTIESDKRYIQMNIEFNKQFAQKIKYFDRVERGRVRRKFNDITSTFLDFNPEKISFELTPEGGMFFSLKKGKYSFYIQYFFENEFGHDEEVLLSIFRDEIKLPSFEGNLIQIISEVRNVISPING